MKRKLILVAVMIGSLAVMGMAGVQEEKGAPSHTGMAMMQSCPVNVKGTDVTVQDTADGISLTLNTKSGDVADLRRRTENMAKMHSAPSNEGMHGNMIPFSVKYEEIPNGAQLTLTPKDPGKLEEFQSKARQHAEEMKKGNCSMIQGMMDGMKNSEPTPKPDAKPTTDESDHSAHHPAGGKK